VETSEVLDLAADEIERRGWQRGGGWLSPISLDTDAVCLEGGIIAAIGLRLDENDPSDHKFTPLLTCPAYRAVTEYLGRIPAYVRPDGSGFEGQPLYYWNDDEAADAEHVIATLRAAAAVERAREAAQERVVEAVSA